MKTSPPTIVRLAGVYGVLLVLLAVTAGTRFLSSGWWSTPISLGIAAVKAFLIFSVFMRLRSQSGLMRIFAVAGFFWLAILLILTSVDYFTRGLPV